MIERKKLKALSKDQLKGQWSTVVLVTLGIVVIEFLVERLISHYESSILLSFCSCLVTAALTIFTTNLYLKVSREVTIKFSDMFVNKRILFKGIGVFILYFIILIPVIIISIIIGALLIFIVSSTSDPSLWLINQNSFSLTYSLLTLLCAFIIIIPIILLSFYMFLALFLLCDDENKRVGEYIITSFKLMYGHMWQFIVLQLSYLGWAFLGIVTLGIGYLWIIPYINTININFFNEIVGYNKENHNTSKLLY